MTDGCLCSAHTGMAIDPGESIWASFRKQKVSYPGVPSQSGKLRW